MTIDSTLDIEQPGQLEAYLRTQGYATAHEPVCVRRLAGGVSNRTMLVRFGDGREWVIKQALAKLRVAVDWYSDPARIEREAQGLRRLSELALPGTITPLVFEDRSHHLLAMQAVPEPHENWKESLLAGKIDGEAVEQFGQLLASIHAKATSQRDTLAAEFADRSFFESLRLEPYYAYTAGQVPAAAEFLRTLIADTRGRGDTLVHGDYSPKNVLIHAGRLVLLDHEVIHWGEPAFDLGFSLTHFLSKAHHLPVHRRAFAAAAIRYWNTYRHTLGDVDWAGDLVSIREPSAEGGQSHFAPKTAQNRDSPRRFSDRHLESRAVCHTLACLLARVAGRSPLEYLGPVERGRQAQVVAALMADPPARIEHLVDGFLERIAYHESH